MDFSYNANGTYNFNKDTFLASIDREGSIILESANGRKKVGVDLETVKEMQDVIDNYYKALVDNGIIKEEPTPEQIAQQQAELLKEQAREQAENQREMFELIKGLKDEIKELKLNGNARYDYKTDSTSVGEKPTRNTASNKPSQKNATVKDK